MTKPKTKRSETFANAAPNTLFSCRRWPGKASGPESYRLAAKPLIDDRDYMPNNFFPCPVLWAKRVNFPDGFIPGEVALESCISSTMNHRWLRAQRSFESMTAAINWLYASRSRR